MKRCKAVTSRVCDSIECCLLAEHEGAHEGQRDKDTRAVWTDPNAPEYLPLDGAPLDGSRAAQEAERDETIAAFERAQAASIRLLADVEPVRTPQTHCHCGAEHRAMLDPSLRTEFGFPLGPWNEETSRIDERFAWPRVCRDCGAVYCQRWDSIKPLG